MLQTADFVECNHQLPQLPDLCQATILSYLPKEEVVGHINLTSDGIGIAPFDAVSIATTIVSAATDIRSQAPSPNFSEVLYFQNVEPGVGPHGLSQGSTTKTQHNGHYGVWGIVQTKHLVALGTIGIYLRIIYIKCPMVLFT